MPKKALEQILVALTIAAGFTTGCSICSSPTGPNNAAGMIDHAGYAFHSWPDGLQILLIYDTPNGFFCEGEATSSSPVYRLDCEADSLDGRSLAWSIETDDGLNADITLAGERYTVEQSAVFMILTTGTNTDVRMVLRDLSGVAFEHERVQAFITADDELSAFLQLIPAP
jgi:hypothetical protein